MRQKKLVEQVLAKTTILQNKTGVAGNFLAKMKII